VLSAGVDGGEVAERLAAAMMLEFIKGGNHNAATFIVSLVGRCAWTDGGGRYLR
jgi:hypothetical protein